MTEITMFQLPGHAGFQNSNPGVEVPIPTPPPSLYTVRVYRSHENSKKSVVVVCMSYLHRLYVKVSNCMHVYALVNLLNS